MTKDMTMTTNNQALNNESLDDFFGEAKSGSDGFGWKNHVISDKDPNIFRIAPAVKSLKNLGKWMQYYALHYGYTIPNPEAPDKPRHKPFQCIFKKNRATGMVEQDCPECQDLAAKAAEIDAMEAAQIAKGKSKEEAEEFVRGARRVLREHNLDKKYYVLAKNLAGEWGVLKLGYKLKEAIENLNEEFSKKNGGASALAASGGVWYEITRKGKGIGTVYSVQIAMESAGGGNFRYKSGALTSTDIEGIKKCPDLATLNDNKVLTYDQILALVRSKGDPTVAAQVFGQPSRAPARPVERAVDPVPAAQPVTTATAVHAAPLPPAEVDQAELAAQIAALQAKLRPATPPAPQPAPQPSQAAPKPVPAATNFSDLIAMDPNAFLDKFGDPNKK